MELDNLTTNRPDVCNIGYDFYTKHKQQAILTFLGLLILTLSILNSVIFFVLKIKSLSTIIILNSTVLILTLIIFAILIHFILKPFKKILNSIFPFTQAKKALSKSFNKNQNLDEILKQFYHLKTLALTENNVNNNHSYSPLQSFLEEIEAGIIVFNPEKEIIYKNNFANKLLDKQGNLIFDYSLNSIAIEDWISSNQATAIHSTYSWDELSAVDAQGEKHWYQATANFQKDQQSETVLIVIDATENYSKKQNDFDFVSFAAHELRGPITIVRGYLDIIKDNPVIIADNETKSIIERLIVAGNRLSGYVNNILNVAKFDQKHLKLFIYNEKIEDIFDEINDDIKLRATTQNRILDINIEPGLPELACDKSSLSQVFTNLIDNAIKYSHENGIINVKAYKKGDYINVEVTDHGIGMPSNVVSNLFKRFYRSHKSKESIGGTGIGLFISKAIVESHGGYITVESIYKEGTTFTVGIPIYNREINSNTEIIQNDKTNWISNHGKLIK